MTQLNTLPKTINLYRKIWNSLLFFKENRKNVLQVHQFFNNNPKKNTVSTGYLLFATVVNCAADRTGHRKFVNILEPKTLTHEFLIKQACCVSVDSASQLLTLTVSALLDLNKDYRETLTKIIALTEESLETISMSAYQENIWDSIIETRARMEDLKKSLLQLSSFMEYVEKVATSAAEASFLGGAEYASTAMCERINSAKQQLETESQKTKSLEEELLQLQKSYVQKATSSGKETVGRNDSDALQVNDELLIDEE